MNYVENMQRSRRIEDLHIRMEEKDSDLALQWIKDTKHKLPLDSSQNYDLLNYSLGKKGGGGKKKRLRLTYSYCKDN